MLKPIETHYNGYRFRSRLEARWAVFLDTLGVKYRYEPEGFDLDGIKYLPDFYLPELGYWLEIKPTAPNDAENNKAAALAAAIHQNVYILIGDPEIPGDAMPDHEGHHVFKVWWEEHAGVYSVGWDNWHLWCECPYCGAIDLQYQGRAGRMECGCIRDRNPDRYDHLMCDRSDRLDAAYTAARSARFEFGESG